MRRAAPLLGNLLIVISVSGLLLVALGQLLGDRLAPAPEAAPPDSSSVDEQADAPDLDAPITKVRIPRISLEAPVASADLIERDGGTTWEIPPFKVGHVRGTAGPGEDGNVVLLGHVSSRHAGNVFADLDKIRPGEQVQLVSDSGRFDYQVVEVRSVPRTDTSVLRPTETPSVSLITCTGTWLPAISDYSDRLVVRAELVRTAAVAISQPADEAGGDSDGATPPPDQGGGEDTQPADS
jgi:LPXTG-site transpeptidase (sortase) family protein